MLYAWHCGRHSCEFETILTLVLGLKKLILSPKLGETRNKLKTILLVSVQKKKKKSGELRAIKKHLQD